MKDYLSNNYSYYTGSPSAFWYNKAGVFHVTNSYYNNIGNTSDVDGHCGVRPVVSLKANTSYTGSGTLTDPFIVS